jgi:hypothetical protein
VLVLLALLGGAEGIPLSLTDVFVSGTEGYACFRIPALVSLPDGNLIAFCEGENLGTKPLGHTVLIDRPSLFRTQGDDSIVKITTGTTL